MKQTFVAIGSNLGDCWSTVTSALAELEQNPHLSAFQLSPWYRSRAIGGPKDQPDYLNAACSFMTELPPMTLLEQLQDLEKRFGRTRSVRWGPRTLDLDIIWMEGVSSSDQQLLLPHPRAHERAFVLRPLIDLKATFQLHGQTLAALAERVCDQIIEPVAGNHSIADA